MSEDRSKTFTSRFRDESSAWRWELEHEVLGHKALRGVIPTAHGYVESYSQVTQEDRPGYSSLKVIVGGVIHERQYDRPYSQLYLCRLAKRFAAEVAAIPDPS